MPVEPFLDLSGPLVSDLVCTGARLRDKLSTIPEMRMEVCTQEGGFDPVSILGSAITLKAQNEFKFSGLCISVEDLGHQDGKDFYAIEVRPWLWLLTIGSDNRIFQEMTTVDVVKKVFEGAGFSAGENFDSKVTEPGQMRENCVQYGESNFDFVSRLMEQDGIYYFFDHSGEKEVMVLAQTISAHPNKGKVAFTVKNLVGDRRADAETVFEWSDVERVVTGKVTMRDYDMKKPGLKLESVNTQPQLQGGHNAIERYHAAGRYVLPVDGDKLAKREGEGYAAEHLRHTGLTNAPAIVTGALFTFEHEARNGAVDGDYLAISSKHYLRYDPGYGSESKRTMNSHVEQIEFPPEMGLYEASFVVQKQAVPFSPPKITAWPKMPSMQTALVVGPAGEEIYTDEHGRIKVQFHWDRLGKKDEKSSCWVRTVMPWGGGGWGMIAIPRIGMEAVIQFESGNIDRPYCTGVVYNGTQVPPYALPAEKTKSGIRTNSSPGGEGFHALIFEDKKNAEEILFQSEKDYVQIIKNNASITIGVDKHDPGNLTQTIHNNKTETIQEGDLTQTVAKGNRIIKIKTNDTETIEGKQTVAITGDTSWTIKEGNKTEKISAGNSALEVSKGNLETTVTMGNITVDASAGKISITAALEIKLTVGSNSVTISPSGVKVEGAMISLDGKAMTEIKGPVVKVAGSAMIDMAGGLVKIN